MGNTTTLRRALRDTFFPYVERKGFGIDKSRQPQFTTFRRITDRTVQVFDIQWDKYGKPRFVINFGEAPIEGVLRYGVPVEARNVEVFDCKPMLRLQRRRGGTMGCWFQLRRPVLQQLLTFQREYTPEEVVREVLAAFPDAEEWWASRADGRHIHGLSNA